MDFLQRCDILWEWVQQETSITQTMFLKYENMSPSAQIPGTSGYVPPGAIFVLYYSWHVTISSNNPANVHCWNCYDQCASIVALTKCSIQLLSKKINDKDYCRQFPRQCVSAVSGSSSTVHCHLPRLMRVDCSQCSVVTVRSVTGEGSTPFSSILSCDKFAHHHHN